MVGLVPGPSGTLRPDGPVASLRDISDLIGGTLAQPGVIVVPLERLDPAFLDLRTGLMGELAQKLANYRLRCAIVGDTGAAEASSRAFRDFRRETNKGRTLVFIQDEAALAAWLER